MTFVCCKGEPGGTHEVKLLSYATVVSGGETPEVQDRLRNRQSPWLVSRGSA
jgi:hypothetical protein